MKQTLPLVVLLLAMHQVSGTGVAGGARAELAMPFTAPPAATQTGLTMDLRYADAEDANAKPPTIEELRLHLPDGTRLDPAAVPYCHASDLEIQLRGRDACPSESLVGTGKLKVFLGAPGDPQTTDLALFNAPGQIIEVLLFEGTNTTAAIEHLFVEGSTIRANTAQVPAAAPPEHRFSASHIVWDIPAREGYLTTPPACPPDGLWRTRGDFRFADGSTATAVGAQPCATGTAEALRVKVRPRVLVRGERTRVQVHVLHSQRACRAGAVARIGGRRAVTDASGRAGVMLTVRRRRAVDVRVGTRSCGTARTTLRTRAR